MADISKIKDENGTIHYIEDAQARTDIDDLKNQFAILPQNPFLTTGGNMTPNNRIKFDRMRVHAGYTVTLTSSDYQLAIDVYNAESGGTRIQNNDWETGRVTFTIEQDGWLLINGARSNRNLAFDSANDLDGLIYVFSLAILDADNTVKYSHLDTQLQTAIDSISSMESDAEYRQLFDNNVFIPELRNGSMGNGGNANAVTTRFIIPIDRDYDYVDFEFIGDTSVANQYGFSYTTFTGATDGMTSTAAFTDSSITHVQYNSNVTEITSDLHKRIYLADLGEIDHMGFYLWRLLDGTYVPLREPADQHCIRLVFGYLEDTGEDEPIDESALKRKFNCLDILEKLKSSRYVKRGTNTPLTLLHFSDPHYDWEACDRIIADADVYGDAVDEIICTGDMAANVGGTIASWWNPKVLTCIGNHDTATYDSSTGYNWTALSMAERDNYYITPYKANWGITHTSGTSYYYKDYTDAKVRLIVLDTMLYTSNGSEATAQTSWLEGLLAGAITSGLHVLIATHAPHPGATPLQSSFTKYGETTMPVHSDCNTPQTVIDTVATKISAGLHFIGYIVGHTHQDDIWDAEGDGKQLMYCVTCANVKQDAQWNQQDLMRSTTQDAYNLVTIDTNNTLVKLIRGGGADIDMNMRTRKAICINYSTGQIVGEV